MPVKFFRLASGEDLISEYEIEDKMIKLTDPYKIVYVIQPDNLFRVTLVPWVFGPLVKEHIYLVSPIQITTFTEASEKLINIYNSIVTEDKKNPMLPVEEELDIMDRNESKLGQEEFLNMVKDKLENISKKPIKPSKRTLH